MRVLPVSLVRMFENTLDWEHLPFLHRTSFTAIACEDAGPWGWRARTRDPQSRESFLELRLDTRQRRWVTRVLEGNGAGAEIWTFVIEHERELIEVIIDFFVPGLPEASREAVGRAYAKAYERLYDEDVGMMRDRQVMLDERIEPLKRDAPAMSLGNRNDIRFPMRTSFAGRGVVVWMVNDQPMVSAARCPHLGAELVGAEQSDGCITCPWHGYRFDLASGHCEGNSTLQVSTPFTAWHESGQVWIGYAKKG